MANLRFLPVTAVLLLAALLSCRTPSQRAARFESLACAADLGACVEHLVEAHGGVDAHRRWSTERVHVRDAWDVVVPAFAVPRTARPAADALDVPRHGGPLPAGPDGDVAFLLALPHSIAAEGARVTGAEAGSWHGAAVLSLQVQWGDGRRASVHFHPSTFQMLGATLRQDSGVRWADAVVKQWNTVGGLHLPTRYELELMPLHARYRVVDVLDVQLRRQ
ncbi:MAG: hypothetical protein HY904_03815 [Deltaproteobacteria bacterium]|nr:hypothetical protein [Deltaproteobacteria bacterium]